MSKVRLTKKRHTQQKHSDEEQFFATVCKYSKDKDIKSYCTDIVPMDEHGLRPDDRLFYKMLGEKSIQNKQVLNATMNVFVLNVKQSNGKEYQPSSMRTKLNRLMKAFKEKGLPEWKIEEFSGEGEWYSMLVNKWETLLKNDKEGKFARKQVAEIDECPT